MAGVRADRPRVAVIGCGAIADEHLTFLSASGLVDLVAVCDLSPALAEHVRQRFGVGRSYDDAARMLDEAALDVVHILTPPRTHPELISRSLDANAHVICEKPMAPTYELTESLLADARRARRMLVETRNLLFNDSVLDLDRLIADGKVGEVKEVDVSLSLDLSNADVHASGVGLPVGLAQDYLPHLAYLLVHFAPGDWQDPRAQGHVANLSGRESIGVDQVDVLVRGGGVRGRLRISPDVQPSALRVSVRGSEGSLEADLYQPFVLREGAPFVGKMAPFGLVAEGFGLATAGVRNVRDRLMRHGTYHGMPRMLEAVYTALIDEQPLPITEQSMLASARLIDRVAEIAGAHP